MLSNDQHILVVTNEEEEKFLRHRPADFDFTKYTKKELRELIATMRTIMRRAGGIGLSANQVGLDMQLFIAEIPQKNRGKKLYAVFNPKITQYAKETHTMEEGCLSVPKTYGTVARPVEIILTGFDKHQRPVKIEADGLLAKVFQHEVDHLTGIVFVDKAKDIYTSKPEDTESGQI